MIKVLVADENSVANLNCCQYLANDKNLDVQSCNSGISTVNMYNKIHPNVLVINSDFKDKRYTEILNELSSTSLERNNSNVILTVEDNGEKIELDFMAKIYKLFYSLDYEKIRKGIEQYNLDNIIFYEPTEKNLRALFYKFNLYNEHIGTDYIKYAIIQCYKTPRLLNSLNNIFSLVAKEFNVSYSSVRPAMRNALKSVNNYRERNSNIGIFKLFENETTITPKNFIKNITEYYLRQKK